MTSLCRHRHSRLFIGCLKLFYYYCQQWVKYLTTRMSASAHCGGRPANYRWRTLFNTAKFGWCPLLECHAVTLPRCETHWNYLRCRKLTNRSQPLVGRCLPYCKDMWRTYCCLTSFFPIIDICLSCEDIARQSVRWCADGDFLSYFFAACVSSEPRAACFRHAF